ncbi:AraC-type DNA-binding protein [Sinosporangium album]|uniref:HTH-type transcriptional regulator RipA n=1 Tax=Sinosporangium album TaxID=504805 RepID=A0A1G8KLD7_9ACTN|nr:AraC-type DNA-binding protein [Sinosporangium album]
MTVLPSDRAVFPPYAMSTGWFGRTSLPPEGRWEPHDHYEHSLLWGVSGGVTVLADHVRWQIPPTVGLWMPSRTVHEVFATVGSSFYMTYFRPEAFVPAALDPEAWRSTGPVAVSRVLREILLHMRAYDMPVPARTRAEHVVFDMMQPLEVAALDVPMPSDPRAEAVARALIANPADPRSLAEWAAVAGGSVRTLTRMFSSGTGMSFAQWRIQVRVRAALTYLAAGMPVSVVSRKVGYSTPSAFVSVFRRVTGRTPGHYFTFPPDMADPRWSVGA